MASGVKGKDSFFEDAKFLDFLFEKISDMIFIFPVEDSGAIGKLTKTNKIACKKLNLSESELHKLAPYELFHEHETAFYSKSDILSFKKNNINFRTFLKSADGDILNVETTIDFCKISDKEFVVFAARDISGRLEAEKALKKSERKCSETILALAASRERLKMAMEAAEEALWDWNIKKGEMYFSPRYYSLLGYEPGDFPQSYNSLESLMHPDDFQEVSGAIIRYVKEGKPQSKKFEFRMRTKSGKWRWILSKAKIFEKDENDAPVRIVGINVDITERKMAEAALRESEERFRLILAHAPIGIIQTSSEGDILWANPTFCKMCEYSLLELNGKNMLELTHHEDREKCIEIIKRIKEGKTDSQITEKRCITKSGKVRWGKMNMTRIKTSAVKDFQNIIMIEDVSDRKNSELELFDAKVRAEAASKAKSMFLANISHEIRTPLNATIGFSEMVLESELSADQRANMEIVKTRSEDLLALINHILDYSKIEAGKLELNESRVELRKVIKETIDTFIPKIKEKKLKIEMNIPSDVPDDLRGDPFRLKQALLNIVGNAVKFTEEGMVAISVFKEDIPEQESSDKVKLHFTVKDTGSGIPEEKLKNIFEDFSQADTSATRKHGGTGLGLAISKSLIEMMGGDIWVESQEEGSLFHFTIKLGVLANQHSRDQEKISNQNSVSSYDSGIKSFSILVVEDESTNQMLIKKLLSKAGHEVTLASNGMEALERIEKKAFDLVLMDVQMPEMDGLTATIILRDEEEQKCKKRLPIIALTAHVGELDIKKCFDSGMDAYLSKPIKKEALFKTINDIAEKFS